MKVEVVNLKIEKCETPVFVATIFQGEKKMNPLLEELDLIVNGKIQNSLNSGEISGKYKEFTFIHSDNKPVKRVLVMGLGKKEKFEADMIRSIMARAARNVRRIRCGEMAVSDFSYLGVDSERAAELIIEGIQLGLYRFNKYISDKEKKRVFLDKLTIVTKSENIEKMRDGVDEGFLLSEATNFTRDLVNEPANILNPDTFSKIIEEECNKVGVEVEIFDRAKLEELGMNLIIAVGRASKIQPKLAILKYKNKNAKYHLGYVGKGVTFDAGGYQVKPDSAMMRMNGDMGGAAAVLSAICAAARNNIEVNITAAIPMAENLINGEAYKPGDIIKSYSGKSVEIMHTDAEGRLILADAISYIAEQKVDYMVDIATLTGGCIVALGHQMSAVLGSDQELVDELISCGKVSSELLWQLPIHDEYLPQLKSDVADLANSGGRPASSITAAMFLKEFTNDLPWAHLDIAGTAVIDKQIFYYYKRPYHPKEGATGMGTRLLYHLAKRYSKK